jgi:hypothetical protein
VNTESFQGCVPGLPVRLSHSRVSTVRVTVAYATTNCRSAFGVNDSEAEVDGLRTTPWQSEGFLPRPRRGALNEGSETPFATTYSTAESMELVESRATMFAHARHFSAARHSCE